MRQVLAGFGSIFVGVWQIMKKMFALRLRVPVAIIIFLMLVSAVASGYVVKRYPESVGLRKGPDDIKRDEESLIDRVRSKVDLPADETPTLATVTDVEKLQTQAFFSKAKNGDRVLIYSDSKKVVLYRPSEDRVIEIGSVNIGETEGVSTDNTLKFAILNGTNSTGLTGVIEDDLKKAFENADIVERKEADSDYEDSVLINIAGNVEVANEISDKLSMKLGELPEGESAPDGVDFVIIIGSDKKTSESN
jgi:hypothetical protein